MKVAITGATGLVGGHLTEALRARGDEVIPLVRRTAKEGEIAWQPERGEIEAEKLEGLGAVVHLAGDNVAKGRWNDAKKRRIRDSRVQGTELLAGALAKLQQPPAVFVSASAIGYYGDQRPSPVDETATRGEGFLADVCEAWEAATAPAEAAGIRTVRTRIGVILSPHGGALHSMLTPFRFGMGGIVGHGQQSWSWISIHDVVGALQHILDNDSLTGPVNLTAPTPRTNAEFTKALGHVLGRPTIVPLPAFAARLVLGEMADALLLSSSRVLPRKLTKSGYQFQHEHLEAALHALLK